MAVHIAAGGIVLLSVEWPPQAAIARQMASGFPEPLIAASLSKWHASVTPAAYRARARCSRAPPALHRAPCPDNQLRPLMQPESRRNLNYPTPASGHQMSFVSGLGVNPEYLVVGRARLGVQLRQPDATEQDPGGFYYRPPMRNPC